MRYRNFFFPVNIQHLNLLIKKFLFLFSRRDWDKYVVDEEINSSKIPAGWITPKYPRDDAWSRLVL